MISSLARCGTAVHLLSVLRNLNRSRFDPRVVGLVERGPIADAIRKLDIDVQENGLRSIYTPAAWKTCWRLARRIRRTRTDIVQTYLFFDNLLGTLARWKAAKSLPHGSRLR